MIQQHNKSGETQKYVRYKLFSRIFIYCIIVLLLLIVVFTQVNSRKPAQLLNGIIADVFQSVFADRDAVETQLSKLDYQTITPLKLEPLAVYMSNIHDDLITLSNYSNESGCTKDDQHRQTAIVVLYHDFYQYISYSLPATQELLTPDEILAISPTDITKLKFIGTVHDIMRNTHEEYGPTLRLTSVEDYFNDLYERVDDYLNQQYNFRLSALTSSSDSILEMLFE